MSLIIILSIVGAIALGVIIVLLLVVKIYNRLVVLRNRYQNAFAQIEVQLKRRHDLIPALVETVKGYMKHEQETLERVISARNQAANSLQAASQSPGNAAAMSSLAGAHNALTGAMGSLFAVMEAYPEIKADTSMTNLQEELTSTENKVAFARQSYNDSVTSYNTYRQSFPPVFIAPMVGHASDASFLEFEDAEAIKSMPNIDMTPNN